MFKWLAEIRISFLEVKRTNLDKEALQSIANRDKQAYQAICTERDITDLSIFKLKKKYSL